MSVGTYARAVFEVVRKDLRLELRTKQTVGVASVFALLVVVAFAFTFVRTGADPATVGRGGLWVAFLFAGTVGVMQTAGVEDRDAALEGLLLAPVDRSSVYVGKVISTAVFVVAVAVLTLAASSVFLGYPLPPEAVLPVVGVVVAAAFGFSAAGVVVAFLAVRSRLGELLVPVVLLPVVVPVLLAGVELTRGVAAGSLPASWLRLLLAYDGILLLAGVATFEYVVEE